MDDATLETALCDLCASYQSAVIDQLVGKTKHVMEVDAYESLGLSGGVANNKVLRSAIQRLAKTMVCPVILPNLATPVIMQR